MQVIVRRARWAAALALLLPLLAACSEESTAPAGAPNDADRAATTTEGSDSGTADQGSGGQGDRGDDGDDGDAGDDASSLAEMAEEVAGEQGDIPPRAHPVLGADVSWPQCPKGMGIPEKRTLGLPMPLDRAEFVVIGLTNGPGFTPNPCLADQVAWVRERGLMAAAYAVASYPDAATVGLYGADGPFSAATEHGRLRNVGYQQARFNVDSMVEAGLQSPIVWVDVEPVSDFEWSADPAANTAVVEGVVRGYEDAGLIVGVYSTPYLWADIVGSLRLRVPEWRAAGETSREEAENRCGDDWSIQGGEAVLGQWLSDNRDHNVTCPGIQVDLGRWFHQY